MLIFILLKTESEQHRGSSAILVLATRGLPVAATIHKSAVSLPTVVNHLQVERLSFVHVVQVFDGDDEAELQDGQT